MASFSCHSTLLGTTDVPCAIEEFPEAKQSDVDEILREISKFLTTPIHASDILAMWCGIRPLVRCASVCHLPLPHP